MSVESQTAGKLDGGGPDIDDIDRAETPYERYSFIKDDFSSFSSMGDQHSELLSSRSRSDVDAESSYQVSKKICFLVISWLCI